LGINIQRAANLEFLKYTGKISYCLYLVHVPICSLLNLPRVHELLQMRSAIWSDAVRFVVSFVLCYALASASWYFFESRILLLKSHFEFRTSPAEPEPAVVSASTGSIHP
jgi:peptidoglycan/LPS O-acetylase OafA/YrhL